MGISVFNSGKYDVFFRYNPFPPLSQCDSTLWNIGDTLSGCDWNSIPWDSIMTCLTLPNFPDCPLITIYYVRICPNNPFIRQIKLNHFELSDIPECESLRIYLDTGNYYDISLKYQKINEQLDSLIGQYEAEQMAAIPSCDSLDNNLQQYVFYNEVACKSKILYTRYIGIDSIPGVIYIDCSREAGCCKRIVTYCRNSLGDIISANLTNEQIGDSCVLDPAEVDYEDIIRYLEAHSDSLSYTILPCTNVCN